MWYDLWDRDAFSVFGWFAAPHLFSILYSLPNARSYFIKTWLFSLCIAVCGGKMDALRVYQKSQKSETLGSAHGVDPGVFAFWRMVVSFDTVGHLLSDRSNDPPSILTGRRFVSTRSDCHRLAPCSGNAKSVWQQGAPIISDLLPRGSQDTCGILSRPGLAACVRRCRKDGEPSSYAAYLLTTTISQ